MCNRNKQTVWFASFVSKTPIKDEYENETGEWKVAYSKPKKALWNVSHINSDVEVAMFGVLAKDTIKIVMPTQELRISNTSILWYGEKPSKPYNAENPNHNYIVSGVRIGLNYAIVYATRVYQ